MATPPRPTQAATPPSPCHTTKRTARRASSPRATASSPTPSSAPPRKRPVRARVARTRRPAHAGRPGRAYSSPTVRCGGRIAGLAVSPGIARDSGRRRAARSIYLRNLHRVGRQRSGISAHPAGRHAFRAVRAHPPRQPHPGARRRRSRDRRAHPGADKHTRQFFWRPRDYAGADFEQSDSMGLLSGTTFHFHATAYGGVQIRFRVQRPDVIHFDDGSAAWCRPSPTAWRGSSGARCSAPR